MLETVVKISNVGVLQAATPVQVALERVALIYADNARGKSTLSSLLRACSEGDAAAVLERKTVGATTAPQVVLRFKNGQTVSAATFNGTTWSAHPAKFSVFNQEFVERNVFASEGVRPEHREKLLEFALGATAVAQRAEFDKQAEFQREKATEVTTAERALQGFRGELSVDAFIALQPVVDGEKQLEAIDKSLAEARDAERIRNRPLFRQVVVPAYDFSELKKLAGSSFESVAATAETLAREHFAAHNGSSTERWVAEGMHHRPDSNCPFCGQSTAGVELLVAYRTYFDEAYKQHSKNVAAMPDQAHAAVSVRQIEEWQRAIEFNLGTFSAWASSLELADSALPSLDVDALIALAMAARQCLQEVAAKKVEQPLTALPTEVFDEVRTSLESLIAAARTFNEGIAALNQKVEAYKASLATADVTALQLKRKELSMQMVRHQPDTVQLVKTLLDARSAYKTAETAKDAAKVELDKQMATTLTAFQGDINAWLAKFGAPFSVQQLAPTYKGGGVRSEYVLSVRGTRVKVGPGEQGELGFHAALSEGDKRTLAFAFFLARLFADGNRAETIVVLDDVFTSLDRHRRHQTADAVVRIAAECAQVIVLGHDAHFLRELKKRAAKKKVGPHVELALHRDGNDYSFLGAFDIDDYCSSDYYKHYVLVERFIDGDHTVPLLEVAKSLRPLVEGHLHRCFPKRFKDGQTVGEMLDHVRNAKAGTPLVRLQPHLDDLVNFNEFAAAYHHDTAGSDTRTDVNAAEMLPFARGAVGFIQSRAFG